MRLYQWRICFWSPPPFGPYLFRNFQKNHQIVPFFQDFLFERVVYTSGLYLPPPDWLGTKRTPIWVQINRKMVNTISFRSDLLRLRNYFRVCAVFVLVNLFSCVLLFVFYYLILLFSYPTESLLLLLGGNKITMIRKSLEEREGKTREI